MEIAEWSSGVKMTWSAWLDVFCDMILDMILDVVRQFFR